MGERLKNFLKRYSFFELGLVLLIFLIPVRATFNLPLVGDEVRLPDFVFLLLFFGWGVGVLRGRRRIVRDSLYLPISIFILFCLLSLFNSIDLAGSSIQVVGMVYLLLFYLLLVNIIDNERSLKIALNAWLTASLAVSLIGLAAFLYTLLTHRNTALAVFYPETSSLIPFPRIRSVLLNVNSLGSYLHIGLVMALSLFFAAKNRRERFWLGNSIFIMSLVAFLTGSRSLLGTALSLFLILLRKGKGTLAKLSAFLMGALVILLLVFVFITTVWIVVPVTTQVEPEEKVVSIKATYASSLYFIQFKAALRMMRRHPLLGVGLQMYNKHLVDYVDWEKEKPSYLARKAMHAYRKGKDPHSTYLGYGAEVGLLGLGALIWIFFTCLREQLRATRSVRDEPWRTLSWGIFAGFIGFLVQGFTDDIYVARYLWFFIALGMVIKRLKVREDGDNEKEEY